MPKPEILDVPPVEAVEDLRAKGYHVGYDWRDTDAQQHLNSFTVAKAARLDVLEAIRAEVDSTIADGITFETFRNNLEPRLKSLGWWGRQPMIDPVTGESRIVQLGSPRRLRTIFDTNLRMAYARGRWERIERVAKDRPYLRYVAVLDARTRPEHMAWHGTVLPWDHPFWRTHYPPCGWHCRCTVIQLSADELKEFGFDLSDAPPDGWDRTRPWLDKRNGRTVQVPVGIDPGFQHNAGLIDVGKDAADRLIAKIDGAPPELGRAAVGEPWRSRLFGRFLETAARGTDHGDFAVGTLDGGVARAIGARSRTVRLSGETAAKQTLRHPYVGAEHYAVARRILDEGELFRGGPRHAIGFIEIDGKLWRTVIKATADGSEAYLQTLHRVGEYDIGAARRRLQRIKRKGA